MSESSEPLGSLCLVLHGHLPYVLHHGAYPHGEAWLYEAAAETYLPLLDLIEEIAQHHARPALTIGLTPVLLEQLAHERFKTGFLLYLNERIDRAAADRREFEAAGDAAFARLAARWETVVRPGAGALRADRPRPARRVRPPLARRARSRS